jgi:carbamate kinase
MKNKMKKEIIVIALGGNAILQANEKGTYQEQVNNVKKAVAEIVKLIKEGYRVLLTHGNGPQVGNLYIQNSLAGEVVPPMPLDACSAKSQGLLGYFIQQAMENELERNNIDLPVCTLVTQVLVAADDPAFKNPTKPIGPFHNKKEAEFLMQKTPFIMKEDSNRRWRRVVPSPRPIGIVEKEIIKKNIDNGYIIVASGGGGIPVIKDGKEIIGVEAVIDKDLSACCLAIDIKANILLILTDIEKVALNYNTPKQKWIDEMDIGEAKKYLSEGHFREGSMKPKIEASIDFLEQGGEKSIIGALFSANAAIKGKSGTTVTR